MHEPSRVAGSASSSLVFQDYLGLLGVQNRSEATIQTLRALHQAHFFGVPFENYSMHSRHAAGMNEAQLLDSVVNSGRGGLCFETGRLMQLAFEELGLKYHRILAGILSPDRGPATHEIFLVDCEEERWLFDIGYGAQGPRGVLPLSDGAMHEDAVLSSRVTLDATDDTARWVVSVKEHAAGEQDWRPIYAFTPTPVNDAEIEMAHFYTVTSPMSLLNIHKVISIPTANGRISVRDDIFTMLDNGAKTSHQMRSAEELVEVLKDHFHISVDQHELPSFTSGQKK